MIAFANQREDLVLAARSQVLRWDSASSRFVHLQDLEIPTPTSMEFFHVDGDDYLAFSSDGIVSKDALLPHITVLKWKPSSSSFLPFQRFNTATVSSLKFFENGSDVYLAASVLYDFEGKDESASLIYKWCGGMGFHVVPVATPAPTPPTDSNPAPAPPTDSNPAPAHNTPVAHQDL